MKTEQILEKLIKFNTVADKENLVIMKYIAGIVKPKGFKIQYVKDKKTNKLNLLAKFNQRRKPVLTFSGHTDTVPATKNWTYQPFQLTCRGDKLYGLGTCDMKGPLAVILGLIKNYNLEKLKKGINLVFTFGEEIDLSGIQDFLKKVKLKTKLIVLAEETGMVPVVASKGAYAIKIEFMGKEAHGAESFKGLNAIMLAQEFATKLSKYFEQVKKTENKVFNNPFATLNIAKIQGGDLINRVPAYCCLEFEYRTINDKQGMQIYQQILEILRKMKCKFKINLDLQIQPMIIKNKKLINDMEKITKQKVTGGNGTTEGSFFSKYGYDCIILGPGNDLAHQPNEYITKDQLNKGLQIYKKIIEQYCL
ncbi:M20/M25/M40 family metallo-hydrolase [Patescibacteria group bacterium]